ncbi:MAG: DNA recombination protein RmuC, partial [Planctomycetaceae bacterium]
MDNIPPAYAGLIGLFAGIGISWILFGAKLRHAADKARSQADAEIAGLKSDISHRNSAFEQLRTDITASRSALKEMQEQVTLLKAREAELNTTIKQERRHAAEKLDVLNQARENLSDAFKALSSEALKNNNESFLKLAQSSLEKFQETARGDLEKRQLAIDAVVKPVEKSLKQVDEKLHDIEKKRLEAYTGLKEQVQMLTRTHNELRSETANLVKALRRPDVRGRWGEIQLKRVVEMAGMLEHCDFFEQQSVATEDGHLRPDLLVQLPGRKNIVIDSKV